MWVKEKGLRAKASPGPARGLGAQRGSGDALVCFPVWEASGWAHEIAATKVSFLEERVWG